MRPLAHLTPRYVADRTRQRWHERRHPHDPWLTASAVQFLAETLQPTDRALEWGSGRSTVWFGARVAGLTSVEADPSWFGRVADQVQAAGLEHVVDLRLVPAPPDGGDADARDPGSRDPDGGAPDAGDPDASEYVGVVRDRDDGSLGLVLVDGAARGHCARAALAKVATGGLLVIDDAHRYLDHPSRAPGNRSGRGPAGPVWAEVWDELRHWRLHWTSDGVGDTAIFIRAGR